MIGLFGTRNRTWWTWIRLGMSEIFIYFFKFIHLWRKVCDLKQVSKTYFSLDPCPSETLQNLLARTLPLIDAFFLCKLRVFRRGHLSIHPAEFFSLYDTANVRRASERAKETMISRIPDACSAAYGCAAGSHLHGSWTCRKGSFARVMRQMMT